MSQCRTVFEDAVGEQLLKFEHKLIKSLVVRTQENKGFAFFAGALCCAEGRQWVYIRCMEIGRFLGVAESLAKQIPKNNRTVIDSTLSGSDVSRVVCEESKPRVDDRYNAFNSFHTFSNSLDPNQFFGGICVESQTGEIFHSAFGLSHLKLTLQFEQIVSQLQRSPRAARGVIALIHSVLNEEPIPFDKQVTLLNTIPSQFTTTKKEGRAGKLPMYVAWPLLSPKQAFLTFPPHIQQIESSLVATVGTRHSKQIRPSRFPTAKRQDPQQALVRRFSRVTSDTRMRLLTAHPELNVQQFKHDLSPVQVFQSSIVSKGHIKLLGNHDNEVIVLWNKFDPVKSEWCELLCISLLCLVLCLFISCEICLLICL